MFDIKTGEEIIKLSCKSDIILSSDVIEKFVKVSIEKYGIIFPYRASPPGYTYHSALKYTDIYLQTLQDKYLILLKEKKIRGGIS